MNDYVTEIQGLPTCFDIASSVLKSSSSARFLICSRSAVAMFMWVSKVAFRAVSSGNCVIAVFRCAALVVRSLYTERKYDQQRSNRLRTREVDNIQP